MSHSLAGYSANNKIELKPVKQKLTPMLSDSELQSSVDDSDAVYCTTQAETVPRTSSHSRKQKLSIRLLKLNSHCYLVISTFVQMFFLCTSGIFKVNFSSDVQEYS